MKTLTLYILQCARRDKIFLSMLIGIFASLFVCAFLGSNAAHEQDQMKIVYSSSAFRIILAYGFAIFNVFFIIRMITSREIETFLAGPISRRSLIISLVLANAMLVFALCVVSVFLLKILFWSIIPLSNAIFWGISLFLEVLTVVVVSVFFSIMLANATTALLLVTIFYITARIMGFILTSIELAMHGVSFIGIVKTLVIPVSVFFPRLDLFSQSSWLIYEGTIANVGIILTQGLVYIPLICLACIVDFNKKSL